MPDPDYAAVPTDILPPLAKHIAEELAKYDDDTHFMLIVHNANGTSTVGTLTGEHRDHVLANVLSQQSTGRGYWAGAWDAETLEPVDISLVQAEGKTVQ